LDTRKLSFCAIDLICRLRHVLPQRYRHPCGCRSRIKRSRVPILVVSQIFLVGDF
jgi:hypothetical protein